MTALKLTAKQRLFDILIGGLGLSILAGFALFLSFGWQAFTLAKDPIKPLKLYPKVQVEAVKAVEAVKPQVKPKPIVITLLDLVNRYRNERGLNSLREDKGLCRLVEERLIEIQSDWSHDGWFERRDANLLLTRYCQGCAWQGENLAKYQKTLNQIISEWDASPSHKSLLNHRANLGCARYAKLDEGLWAVLEVGRR